MVRRYEGAERGRSHLQIIPQPLHEEARVRHAPLLAVRRRRAGRQLVPNRGEQPAGDKTDEGIGQ